MPNRDRRILYFAALWIGVLALHSATTGLSDDEAYYWVLAQRPAWGYAFHPPGIGWVIALFQAMLGWLSESQSYRIFIVRLPALVCLALSVRLTLIWLREAGLGGSLLRGVMALFSFAGIFALSWMIVPDLPLIFGWMLAFVGTWRACFFPSARSLFFISSGCALLMASKYSGILAVISCVACLVLWSSPGLRLRSIIAALAGACLVLLPNLIWNSQHEWGALAYQFSERHGDGTVSWTRFARFWAIQFLVTGPWLFFAPWKLVRASIRGPGSRVPRFLLVWIIPASVFWIQPLFSEFKPHWALIAWWPVALGMVWMIVKVQMTSALLKAQIAYGYALTAIVLIGCHFPLGARFTSNPLLDVSNDLYGWSDLSRWMRAELSVEDRALAVSASRYQTASQAMFSLSASRVSLIPRDLKARDEWPEIDVTDSSGPEWPRLLKPVLFVGDNRYSAGPEFKNASCMELKRFQFTRGGFLAKEILLWKCIPGI